MYLPSCNRDFKEATEDLTVSFLRTEEVFCKWRFIGLFAFVDMKVSLGVRENNL